MSPPSGGARELVDDQIGMADCRSQFPVTRPPPDPGYDHPLASSTYYLA